MTVTRWRRAVAALAVLGTTTCLYAAPGQIEGIPRNDRYRFTTPDTPPSEIASSVEGVTIRTVSAARRDRLAPQVLRSGDGGGAAVSEFVAVQGGYVGSACAGDCDGAPCNSVLLIWNEDSIESAGVRVAMDGVELGTVNGLLPDQLPGANAVSIVGVQDGQRAFQILSDANGSSGTDTIMVVDQ